METLRVLMVSTHYPPAHLGGDAKLVEYVSNELVRRGHEVHVLHSPAAYVLQRKTLPPLDSISKGGVFRHVYYPRTGRIDPILALLMGRGASSHKEFRDLVSKLRPDVVHWHNTKGFIGQPISTPTSISMYTAHDFYAVCPRSSLLKPGLRICEKPYFCQLCLLHWRKPPQLWRIWNNRVVRFPKEMKVISPSEFLARRLAEDGIRVDHVLRNFVPRMTLPTAELGEPTRIVFLGVLERQKGLFTLLDAFHHCRNLQEFRLSIFGEGSIKALLKKRIEALGLETRVAIHGYVPLDELTAVLRETAAIIVPSESYENAPLVALEALSMGIPVIGSNLGGLPEILQPGSGCVLFPAGIAEQLSQEIVTLWNNREDLPKTRRMARATYEARFSPDIHIREYMSILRQTDRPSP